MEASTSQTPTNDTGSLEADVQVPDTDRSSGRLVTAQRLWRDHGADLTRLASALLDDDGDAATAIVEAVVAEVLPMTARHHHVPTRRELAERVHLRCRQTSPIDPESWPGTASRAALVERHQEPAVALYVYGHLPPQRIARLLNLSLRSVCLLLLRNLDGLAQHDHSPRPRA